MALLDDPVPPVALAPYLEQLISGRTFEPMSIDNPVIIIANPAAGNGKGYGVAAELHTGLNKAMASGRITVDGDIIYHETIKDPAMRANAIVNVVKGFSPERPPYVISIGGDGTAADVMEAVMKVSNGEYRPYVIPGPGGTANDLRRNQGFSSNPAELLFQLPKAVPAEFDIVYVTINGGEPELLLHSQSTGASGNFFKAVNDRLAHLKSTGRLRPISGPVSYLVKAPGAILGTQTFQVRVFYRLFC